MVIKLLSREIVNQIAAGEVIENPSAVVKELVENSLDSGANIIEVEVEESGLKSIVVKDNGCGILKEDLLKAPLRHATSKIRSFNDLYNIKTMGFRGEALASIFSVAKTKIISKSKDEKEGYEISSEDVSKVKKSGADFGTTVFVEDLFYNTPARKKYLKSKNLELKNIIDVFNRFVAFYYDVKFVLKHNGKILVNKPIFKSLEESLYYVFGKELRNNLVFFENDMNGLRVSGFLGKPSSLTYSYVKNQFMYVNSRFVKSKIVRDAVYEGYGTSLMSGRHPFFVLFISIDPEIIDVNVHPTKIEIKFENELDIFEFVKDSVKHVFEKTDFIKEFDEKIERDFGLDEMIDEVEPVKEVVSKVEHKSYFTSDSQKVLEVKEDVIGYNRDLEMKSYNVSDGMKEDSPVSSLQSPTYDHPGPLFDILKEFRVVGLVNKTYVILETKSEMILVDFHAAAEKIAFENLMNNYESGKIKKQVLLEPVVLKLDNSEMLSYKENKDLIERLGVVCEEFGKNEVVIREVPIGFLGKELNPKILKEILHDITIDKKFKGKEIEKVEKLARVACRSSVKAGYEMTNVEIAKLIKNLKRLKEPFNCPHGRPVLLRFTFRELEKKFKRIV